MHHFLFSLLCLVVFHQLQLCLVTPVFLSSPHASLRSRSSQSEESCVKGEELKQLASAQYKMGTSLNYGSYKTTAAEPEYEIVELNSSPLTIGQTWALHFKWNEPEWTLGFGTITAANMLTPDSQNISSLAHLRFFGVNTDVGLYIISHSASNGVCFAFVLCLFQFSYHTFPHCFLTSFHLHYLIWWWTENLYRPTFCTQKSHQSSPQPIPVCICIYHLLCVYNRTVVGL